MHRFVMSRNKTEVIFNSFKAVFPLIICTTTFIYICIYIYTNDWLGTIIPYCIY